MFLRPRAIVGAFASSTSLRVYRHSLLGSLCSLRCSKDVHGNFGIIRMASTDSSRRVLVPIGTGSEEIEAVTIIDTLRRAGAQVTVASVEPESTTVKMSRGVVLVADTLIKTAAESDVVYDAIAMPGGMPGAERLRDSEMLMKIVRDAYESGRLVAAICASPAVVLAHHGLLKGKKATCYPAEKFRSMIPTVEKGDVVKDGSVITGTAPGTALKFALALVEALYSKEMSDKLAVEMLAEVAPVAA